MALDTFPSITAHYGSAPGDIEPNVIRNDFGDGYSQRVTLGLNPESEDLSLVWKFINTATKETIVSFLSGKGAITAFLYTFPGSTEKTYTCPKWKAVPASSVSWNVSAKFIQEFDL